MAKPRIFISSTYYDLRYIRESMKNFIDMYGYESVLFENGDIPYVSSEPLDYSCYKEVENCHMLILIIGGRYGSLSIDSTNNEVFEHYNSITSNEYKTAIDAGIPAYIFIESSVASEFETYKNNKNVKDVNYAHVDNIKIFELIENIHRQRTNNNIHSFEKSEDIFHYLKEQWAGLFELYLKENTENIQLRGLSEQVKDLSSVVETLKKLSESILRKSDPKGSEKIISELEFNLYFDTLTSLYNRRGFIHKTHDRIFEYQQKENRPQLALGMIDLNDFKEVNDKHGHQVGDNVLQEVANILVNTLHEFNPIISRLGGDEFAFLLIDVSPHNCLSLVDILLKNIGEHNFKEQGLKTGITASIGLYYDFESHSQNQVINKLLNGADMLLNDARTSGKNTIETNIY